jgi:hypothetical protein
LVGDGDPAAELLVAARRLQRADEAVHTGEVSEGNVAAARAAVPVLSGVAIAAGGAHGMPILALQCTGPGTNQNLECQGQ